MLLRVNFLRIVEIAHKLPILPVVGEVEEGLIWCVGGRRSSSRGRIERVARPLAHRSFGIIHSPWILSVGVSRSSNSLNVAYIRSGRHSCREHVLRRPTDCVWPFPICAIVKALEQCIKDGPPSIVARNQAVRQTPVRRLMMVGHDSPLASADLACLDARMAREWFRVIEEGKAAEACRYLVVLSFQVCSVCGVTSVMETRYD